MMYATVHPLDPSLFEGLAAEGDVLAQVWVGNMYISGRGVEQDVRAGMFWLERASSFGNPQAKYALGRQALIAADYQRAAVLFDEAARRGYYPALFWLASLWERGLGREADLQKAIELLKRAEALGHVPSRGRLGRFHLGGHLGPWRRPLGLWLLSSE